ncbi:uncharacterized aarF domain-containing protein kinase 5 isoform X3 [Vombatus ursinus]|uniref:uncharacterized aarF domain-containing protein kinase 5 isoform X3 n=1 Tax=Vombatus ursinus TaxID=29139 RepID=UPI000FFD479B|nr:uncharacterized aarF domain-containing protein kinase 5 isoform X3 [Vombatus ursinus]
MSRTLQLCRFHSALLQSRQPPWLSPVVFLRKNLTAGPARSLLASPAVPRPLWKKAISAVVVGVPLLFGLRYAVANKRERRKMRLLADGIGRFGRSLKVGLQISMDYWWCTNVILRGVDENSPGYMEVMSACHQRAADALVAGAILNGGLYVKLGQGLCSFNHLLPPEYITTLRLLEDKALTRGYKEVDELFLEDFQAPANEVFQEFDYEPVAAASLAQVHKAKLKDGTEVAVKDLKGTLAQELDFENEARNSERCADDLKHFGYIVVPRVHWDKSSKRVLTADFCNGCKVNNVEEIQNQGLSLSDISSKLIRVFAEQIFYTGFIHSDPHPGNGKMPLLRGKRLVWPFKVGLSLGTPHPYSLLVLVRKGSDGQAELVLLDHGLYQFLDKKDRLALCQLWRAIILRDDAAMKKHSAELGVEDYFLFCEILMQRPIHMEQLWQSGMLSHAETAYMQEMAQEHFARIMEVLKALPRPMLLVLRNINTVRAITMTLKAPVDRYFLMAKSAVRSWSRLVGEQTRGTFYRRLVNWVKVTWESFKFEIVLRLEMLSMHLTSMIIKFLVYLGVMPEPEEIFKKMEP